MKPLLISQDDVSFQYQQKAHLKTTLLLKNQSSLPSYFKFKLSRPKFYLIKPDKGFISPGQEQTIEITLHENGIPEAENDKIKIFYKYVSTTQTPPATLEDDESTFSVRMTVLIEGLPDQFKKKIDIRNSEVKSVGSNNLFGLNSPILESSIREKQSKVVSLRKDVQEYRLRSTIRQEKESKVSWIVIGVVGLLLGVVSSLWI